MQGQGPPTVRYSVVLWRLHCNILSLNNVKKNYHVTYDNTACDCFKYTKQMVCRHSTPVWQTCMKCSWVPFKHTVVKEPWRMLGNLIYPLPNELDSNSPLYSRFVDLACGSTVLFIMSRMSNMGLLNNYGCGLVRNSHKFYPQAW